MRTAFVIPWFGSELVGGAEQHVFQVATRLARRGLSIEVLTTCCRSFRDDWGVNHLPPGASEECGVVVRRFPVDPRNRDAFDAANQALLELNETPKPVGVSPVPSRVARDFVDENIHSRKLLDYIEQEHEAYDALVFAPYLYGPTLLGIGLAGPRAVLQPLLHDETYAYLPQVERAFLAARRVLFISEGEAQLAVRLFGAWICRNGMVTGAGVETTAVSTRDEQMTASIPADPFVLYLGRRDPAKGTTMLLEAFKSFRADHPGAPLQLVLAGPGALREEDLPAGVIDAGLVSTTTRDALLRHCRALLQPSRNESYSRAMLEAWLHGKPVVVNADCLATRIPVETTDGGWSCATQDDWVNAFATVAAAPEGDLASRGENGRRYALDHGDWDRAIDRYERALSFESTRRARRGHRPRPVRAVHQILPNLSYGDAISNQATFVRELLRELGYESEIFVQYLDERMSELGRPFERDLLRPEHALLYHHSIGTTLTQVAVRHPGPKALVYHNITPPQFYEPWDASFARLLESGRDALPALAPTFPLSFADSHYNAAELRESGFREPGVLPIFVDPMRWAQPADPRWMQALQDGRTNLLFVGRMAPNKCQHHLLEAFAEYLTFDPDARLLLVGGWRDGDPYANFVRGLVHSLGIASQVVIARGCTDAELLACYRCADLFWSMSEHEGFCVPLVEAMWFDVPVLAYRAAAVPETLADAGVMFTEKRWPELAALAHLLIEDEELRPRVVATQRSRRDRFLPESILPVFLDVLSTLTVRMKNARTVS